MMMMRAFLVSLMDNVYHYRTPLNLTVSGYNLSVPRFLSVPLLNFNLHRVHHTNPSVPWAMLPFFFQHDSDRFDRSLFLAVVDQFLGPVPADQLEMGLSKSGIG